MEQQTLNLPDPGVLEALCDGDAMRAWYRLRVSVHPLSTSEVAEGIRLELGPTHCKRMFEKLGIRRAVELNRFSFDRAVGKPHRARRTVKA